MLPVLLFFSAVAPLVLGQSVKTSATCSPDFAWMANSKGASPCQAAASVDSLCNNGNWDLPKLNASIKYNNPKVLDATATLCTCSWASYNLISACTACQGFPEQIPFWGDYSTECGGKISESYWPSSIFLPSTISFPFWSTKNPTEWTNQKFTPSEAKALVQKGDVGEPLPTQAPRKKKTPVGPIVGGVVGGLVVIALFAGIACFMLRHQKQAKAANGTVFTDEKPPHSRKISDTTVNSNIYSNGGWFSLHSTTPMITNPNSTNAIAHAPGYSISSTPSFIGDSTQTQSPSPPTASPQRRPEDVVTPFTLAPTVDNPDQKRSHGSWPVFDQPSAPPGIRMEVTPLQSTPSRSRYLPPAYTESSPGGSSTPQRHGSIDSHQSSPSNIYARTSHVPGNSMSSMGHAAVTPMTPMTETASELGSPLSHGRSLAGPSMDHKRRPTQDSMDNDHDPSIA